ncbi:unnamed protein product [Toxocara canis]|uniref:Myb-like domain-containing protein n=1 Tax=Toxocara canis TaxID=6265 RepID=A0A183UBV1_TOXCA|nr:unnamed protein product [Toxocara canis]
MTGWLGHILMLGVMCGLAKCWSNDELALYDLVEEVNANFYELFSVKQVAAIYEVLKSPQLRGTYDNVLEFGLPDWRQPIYYIRRARKLSWIETAFVLLIISTVTHYLMLWGAYIDKYWVMLSRTGKARKKELRLARKAGAVNAEEAFDAAISAQLADARPTLRNLLPILILSTFYKLAILSPALVQQSYEYFRAPQESSEEDEPKELPAYMELSPQPIYEYAVANDLKPVLTTQYTATDSKNNISDGHRPHNLIRDDKWNCEELELLVKLTTEKYPAGTPDRWKLVGRVLNRSPEEVAAMTGKLKLVRKDEYAKLLRAAQSSSVVVAAANVTALRGTVGESNGEVDNESSAISPIRPTDEPNSALDWSQHDQRLFETALQQFPKGTADRWDKIVNCVPNKTKQQCIDRFKYLSEMVRQRKLQHRNKK